MSDTEWSALVSQWLPLAFPAIAAHNHRLAQGERGVMLVSLERRTLEALLGGKPVRLDPIWLPAGEFIASLRQDGGSIPAESVDRWEQRLQLMDPKRDVALFLSGADQNTDDDGGPFFTRFIVTHDGSVPAH